MVAIVNIKTVSLHPDFPETVWVVIEQPPNEPYRLSYDPIDGSFNRTTTRSLVYERGFHGAYGWLGGMGAPPDPHFDILLITRQSPRPGDILAGIICGVFYRGDGDHKFVALDFELRSTVVRADLDALDKRTYDELMHLYPRIGRSEGWHSAEEARSFLKQNRPVHD